METRGKKLKKSTPKTNTNATSIYALTDDCLIRIFAYLPIKDRIRIQRVCKQWKAVAELPWWEFKILNFKRIKWGLSINCYFEITISMIKHVLKYCSNISYVDFTSLVCDSVRIENSIVQTVIDSSPNLASVDCGTINCTKKLLRCLSLNCNNITAITFGPSKYPLDCELANTFSSMKKLRKLEMQSMFVTSGKCFLKLPSTIEDIILLIHTIPSNKYFRKAFQKMNLLHTLKISFYDNSYPSEEYFFYEIIRGISDNATNMKNLVIKAYSLFLNLNHSIICENIPKLVNLQTLELSGKALSNELLIALEKNCKQLSNVIFSYSKPESLSEGLEKFATLPKLEHLQFIDILGVQCKFFYKNHNLKSLKIVACDGLNANDFAPLMETLDTITVLSCPDISHRDLILIACAVARNRKQEDPLKLLIDTHEINVTSTNISKRLQIVCIKPQYLHRIYIENASDRFEMMYADHSHYFYYK